MSTNLYWSVIPPKPDDNGLYSIKRIMAAKLGEYDGSMGEDLGIVDDSIIPFLEGLVAGDTSIDRGISEDAQSLIDAIRKHGKVQLTIH